MTQGWKPAIIQLMTAYYLQQKKLEEVLGVVLMKLGRLWVKKPYIP